MFLMLIKVGMKDSAKSVYGEVFKYSVKFYPFTYANEKFWK